MQTTHMVIGAQRVNGVNAKGSAFDMTVVRFLAPIETGTRGKVSVDGSGYEVKDIPATPESLADFAKFSDKLPCEVSLNIEAQVGRFGNYEPVVTGAQLAKPAAVRAAS